MQNNTHMVLFASSIATSVQCLALSILLKSSYIQQFTAKISCKFICILVCIFRGNMGSVLVKEPRLCIGHKEKQHVHLGEHSHATCRQLWFEPRKQCQCPTRIAKLTANYVNYYSVISLMDPLDLLQNVN